MDLEFIDVVVIIGVWNMIFEIFIIFVVLFEDSIVVWLLYGVGFI